MPESDLGDLDLDRLAFLPGMTPAAFAGITRQFEDPTAAFAASVEDLTGRVGLPAALARTILAAAGEGSEEFSETVQALDSLGVEMRWRHREPPDPSRVKTGPEWAFLTLLGNGSLLESRRIVGIVGRRQATEQGLQFAHDLAAALADDGTATISGLARGIDRAAHRGSIEAGGGTIGLAPEGILEFVRRQSPASPLPASGDSESLLVISGAPPWEKWSVGEAMRRNRWIAAWCDCLVVVEADSNGGTWRTAEAAARFGKPIWVASGFDETHGERGNEALAGAFGCERLDVRAGFAEAVEKLTAN